MTPFSLAAILRSTGTKQKEVNMEGLWLALYWTGPIGIGAFLAGLGVLFWGISVARRKESSPSPSLGKRGD